MIARGRARQLRIALCASFAWAAACGDDTQAHTALTQVVPWPIPAVGSPATDMGGALPEGDASTAGEDAGPAMDPDPALALLDPDQVYLFGTLAEGACDRDAIALVTQPNHALVGFRCETDYFGNVVRPSDGRMLYLDNAEETVFAFHCDGCTYASALGMYPSEPQSNDEVVAQDPCPTSLEYIRQFAVSVAGETFAACSDGNWYGSDGKKLDLGAGSASLHFGHANTALLDDGVFDLATGTLHPVEGLPEISRLAVRARSDGYWIAGSTSGSSDPVTLWKIAFDGKATGVAQYPAPPLHQQLRGESALDASGDLFQLAEDDREAFRETVVRRTLAGKSAVVYDEATHPIVKVHLSSLFTGP